MQLPTTELLLRQLMGRYKLSLEYLTRSPDFNQLDLLEGALLDYWFCRDQIIELSTMGCIADCWRKQVSHVVDRPSYRDTFRSAAIQRLEDYLKLVPGNQLSHHILGKLKQA